MVAQTTFLSGFGNFLSSEALANALPRQQNNPQKVPLGLYAEQLSGTAFTVERQANLRTWFYKIKPSVVHGNFTIKEQALWVTPPFHHVYPPQQMRWSPLPADPHKTVDIIDSIITIAAHGNPLNFSGAACHWYAANCEKRERYFYNADAEMLFIPVNGTLTLFTECGYLVLTPGHIGVLPRGMKCQFLLPEGFAHGYVAENFGAPLTLPPLGVVGPNVLAEPRHFLAPVAAFEERRGDFTLFCRSGGNLWSSAITTSPLDVVAWHGNYLPYQYDLNLFTTINAVSHDHPDPSIFTVLSSPSTVTNTANLDLVIFPSRWMVMEHTMRLPYYHRNLMSELMGLIYGEYDAKLAGQDGFAPGGVSIHNCMVPHGPETAAYTKAINSALKPEYYQQTLAFMLESHQRWHPSAWALSSPLLQENYRACWQDLPQTFKNN